MWQDRPDSRLLLQFQGAEQCAWPAGHWNPAGFLRLLPVNPVLFIQNLKKGAALRHRFRRSQEEQTLGSQRKMESVQRPHLRARTAALWIVWFGINLSYYGAFIWLPSLLVAQGFDLVTSMEVIEHVSDPAAFVRGLVACLADDGIMILSTPNRTPLSRLAMITIGESIGGIPRGTHDWNKFLTPAELEALITRHGLRIADRTGVVFHPLADEWRRSRDLGINYMILAERPSASRVSSTP